MFICVLAYGTHHSSSLRVVSPRQSLLDTILGEGQVISMAIRLDGKKVAESIYTDLAEEVAQMNGTPKIVFIRVGEDPASQTYVNAKAKKCKAIGALSDTIVYPESVSQTELIDKVRWLNQEQSVRGILVQLPLPAHLDKNEVLEAIHPEKDVDGLHSENVGRLVKGTPRFIPCTPGGIVEMLKFYEIPVEGKNVTIVGRSDIVGKPAALLMLLNHATVTVCHSRTKNLPEVTSRADILIAAAGKPHLIGPEHLKEGATVIDVGIHRVNDMLVGDVNFAAVESKVHAISPVPGGVGPMTIAMLMRNLVKARNPRY